MLHLKPKTAEAFLLRARCRRLLNQLDQSLQDANIAVQLAPAESAPLFERALIRFERHDFAEALKDFAPLVSRKFEDPLLFWYTGRAREETGQLAGAIDDFARLLALKDAHVEGHSHRANLLMRLTRFNEAVAEFRKLQRLQPRNPSVWY